MLHASTRLDLRRAKTLLVDDNPHSTALIAQVLQGFRLEKVTFCASAEEAREMVGTTPFDLLIIDLEMPIEDGISLTRHIRSNANLPNFTTHIILMAAHTSAKWISKARDAGANFVVKKPITPAALLQRIEWLARNTRQFVASDTYSGPDRRLKKLGPPPGVEERRHDAIALTACPERAMAQEDIDALFG